MPVYVALIVALIGLVIFIAVRNSPDLKEVGRILFGVGLFVFLLLWPKAVALIR
jgi:Na+/phosphate symporter